MSARATPVRPRFRGAGQQRQTATDANSARGAKVMIRVPWKAVDDVRTMSMGSNDALASTTKIDGPGPSDQSPTANLPLSSIESHTRIDNAHAAVSGPHLAGNAWSAPQAELFQKMGGWKAVAAIGLVLAVAIGAFAARVGSQEGASDDDVIAKRVERRERRRSRRYEKATASELSRASASDELNAQAWERANAPGGDFADSSHSSPPDWRFAAAANTPATLSPGGPRPAVNLEVENTGRLHNRRIRNSPDLPASFVGGDANPASSPYLTDKPRYRMAANDRTRPSVSPNANSGTAQLQGTIGHLPAQGAP